MVFETDENQDGFEQAPRSYLGQRGQKTGRSRKTFWFALILAAGVIILAAGVMVLLSDGDKPSGGVSSKKTLEIGNAGNLPRAPSQKRPASGQEGETGAENFIGLESAISDMETKIDENHEQLMGRVAELARRVVENNEHARESLKKMEALEARIEKLEKQYQKDQLTAGARAGAGEKESRDTASQTASVGTETKKKKTPAAGKEKSEGRYYTVKKNDTMYSIAKNHGIKLETFLEINGLNRDSVIYPVQRLKVRP